MSKRSTTTPSTLTAPSAAISSSRRGRRASRRASHSAQAADAGANTHHPPTGNSDHHNDSGTSRASADNAATSQRDGRNSSRQGEDALDEGIEESVVGTLIAEEPAPQAVVLAIEQAFEIRAFGGVGTGPATVEIAAQ
jgi:hypothetical protein